MKPTIYLLSIISILLTIACNNKPQNGKQTNPNYHDNLIKANKGLVTSDQQKIITYVKHRNWQMQTTETGLWFQIISKGNGAKAQNGMIAHLKYTLSLIDGTICYTSDSLGPKTFRIGSGGVESGLEEGILLLSQGDKARFILPPHLAHGLLGDQNKIPARSIIVYHVELINLSNY